MIRGRDFGALLTVYTKRKVCIFSVISLCVALCYLQSQSIQVLEQKKTAAVQPYDLISTVAQRDQLQLSSTQAFGGNTVAQRDQLQLSSTQAFGGNRERKSQLQRHFAPLLTPDERLTLLRTLRVLVDGFHSANVSYHMCGGTLLGSYLHHGMIPWDDDVDLCVTYGDRKRLYHAMRSLETVKRADDTLYSFVIPDNQMRWKFFSLNGTVPVRRQPDFKWRVPFIDICFYDEDNHSIWDLSMGPPETNTKRFNKSIVFPLGWRPFEGMTLRAPRDPRTYLRHNYKLNWCITNAYSHLDEVFFNGKQKMVPCRHLRQFFPFVFRNTDSSQSNRTYEILQRGDVVLGREVVDLMGLLLTPEKA